MSDSYHSLLLMVIYQAGTSGSLSGSGGVIITSSSQSAHDSDDVVGVQVYSFPLSCP